MITAENLKWLEAYRQAPPNLGLERVQELLKRLGDPQNRLSLIHVAGTNGKGSTIAHLNQLLQAHGLKVGVFNSPYLVRYSEQFKVNDQEISPADLNALLSEYHQTHLTPQIPGLTEFEIMTALALDYFARQAADVAIIEVGMGGRLDSTNVIQPDLTILTNVALDHTAFLGDTLAAIAYQKAGIIKPQTPLVCGDLQPEAQAVVGQIASDLRVGLWQSPKAFEGRYLQSLPAGETFEYIDNGHRVSSYTTPLLGKHQVANAALALRAAGLYAEMKGYPPLSSGEVQEALNRVVWAGRMERISERPLIYVDGAHNPHAIKPLVENVSGRFAGSRVRVLFACIQTKALEEMVALLEGIPNVELLLTTFDDPRAYSSEAMEAVAAARGHRVVDWKDFLDGYEAGEKEVLLITGSLYFIGTVKKARGWK